MHCFLNSRHLSIDCLSICLGRIISRSARKERPGWRNELCGLVVCKWKSATSFTSWQHGFTESNRQALLHANFVLQCGVRPTDTHIFILREHQRGQNSHGPCVQLNAVRIQESHRKQCISYTLKNSIKLSQAYEGWAIYASIDFIFLHRHLSVIL